ERGQNRSRPGAGGVQQSPSRLRGQLRRGLQTVGDVPHLAGPQAGRLQPADLLGRAREVRVRVGSDVRVCVGSDVRVCVGSQVCVVQQARFFEQAGGGQEFGELFGIRFDEVG